MGKPNAHAKCCVKNDWGAEITNINVTHRYDNDHTDSKHYDRIEQGATSDTFNIGYWTGTFRSGKDYWYIEFTDSTGTTWNCKSNFYCYLTDADKGKTITLVITNHNMEVDCPDSSDCNVSLHQKS
ncbi:MAG: hypothetical protein AB8H03_23710 [Saprospiraceae bacterium]